MSSGVLAKQYRLIYELNLESDGATPNEGWFAQDIRSPNEDAVRVRLLRYSYKDELSQLFMERAKELSSLRFRHLIPLIDYGYDHHENAYYLVYQDAAGKKLSQYLADAD